MIQRINLSGLWFITVFYTSVTHSPFEVLSTVAYLFRILIKKFVSESLDSLRNCFIDVLLGVGAIVNCRIFSRILLRIFVSGFPTPLLQALATPTSNCKQKSNHVGLIRIGNYKAMSWSGSCPPQSWSFNSPSWFQNFLHIEEHMHDHKKRPQKPFVALKG